MRSQEGIKVAALKNREKNVVSVSNKEEKMNIEDDGLSMFTDDSSTMLTDKTRLK